MKEKLKIPNNCTRHSFWQKPKYDLVELVSEEQQNKKLRMISDDVTQRLTLSPQKAARDRNVTFVHIHHYLQHKQPGADLE